MNGKRWQIAAATAVLALAGAAVAQERGSFDIVLRFVPQENVDVSMPTLPPGVRERPLKLVYEDARPVSDKVVVGDSSDDRDVISPIRAANDVATFGEQVLRRNADQWAIRLAPDADLTLAVRLTRFFVSERKRPIGSTYTAEAQVAFTLADARGRPLWEGAAAGDAARYGRSRSADNCNEVLSNAIKEAYADLFSNVGLQGAWMGKAAPRPPRRIAPADLLADLVKLKGQGFATDVLVDYVNQRTLARALSADDLVRWKDAGMPEEVIKAALAHSPESR
jgi:hypothetical protein